MFEAVKVKAAKKSLIDLLTFIVTSTTGPTAGFGYAPEADLLKLHKAEPTFITIDSTVKDSHGSVKATATQVAIDALMADTAKSAAQVEEKAKPEPMNFEMGFLDALPQINKGSSKTDSYPFDKLAAPEPVVDGKGAPVYLADGKTPKMKLAFFFVPATEAKPNPSKFLSSTVASANKRHAKTDKAAYTVRKRVDAAGKIDGANVIRIA